MNERIIELAKKLKALADRGEGGEKQNANEMLHKYMEAHNITFEDIEGRIIKEHDFFISESQKKFFCQIASSVLGPMYKFGKWYLKGRRQPGKDRFFIECTDSEFVEIKAKFDFYFSAYEKEVAIFYSAFIQKNKIYSKEEDGEPEEPIELTIEEKKRLLKVQQMMQSIEQQTFHKQLP